MYKIANLEKIKYLLKAFILSTIGIFVFFIPISFQDRTTILIDLIISLITKITGDYIKWIVVLICIWSVYTGYKARIFCENVTQGILYVFRTAGLLLALCYVIRIGPERLFEQNVLPFLFNICKSIIYLAPIGGMLLCLLTDYGLMEFFGYFLEKLMMIVWKVPGEAAVDALASFVGSFSIGYLLTDKMYKDKRYSYKQAMIIATGFSTVSTTFMITLTKSLDIMDAWGLFFCSAFVINMLVTAVVIRLYPIRCYDNTKDDRIDVYQNEADQLLLEKIANRAKYAKPLKTNFRYGFMSGIKMVCIMIPMILSVGTFGILLVHNTLLFDFCGYIFKPLLHLFYSNEASILSKALATTFIDTFLPVPFILGFTKEIKFFCGVVAVTENLFWTASIPTLLATTIPIRIKDLFVIWLERMIVSIVITGIWVKVIFILF